MALAKYHATLEYAPNIIEFWRTDDAGELVTFGTGLTFNINRIDGTGTPYVKTAVEVEVGHLVIEVNPPSYLKATGDTTQDYDVDTYEHNWSIRSSAEVILYGKMNLVEVP